MNHRIDKLIKTAVCLFLIVSLSGCWNNRELDTLGIVMGVGLDKPAEGGRIKITAQLVNPNNSSSSKNGGGSGSDSSPFWNVEATGDTVFSAVRDLTDISSRRLFFPHNQVLVFGKSLAENGVRDYIDFFARDPETRPNVLILISEGTAEEILNTKSKLEAMPAENIHQLIDGASANTSQIASVKLKDLITRLMSKTTAPIAPMIEITERGGEKTATLSGTAVFKDDKLVGKLDKTEGRGLLWVLDEVESGIIKVNHKTSGDLISIEIVRANGKFKPEIKDGKIKIKIDITESGNIGDQSGDEDLSELSEISILEDELSETIRDEIMSAIEKAKNLNTDIFGFGDSIHQHYPKEWKELEDKWDEIFPQLEVEIKVEAKIRLMGRISSPAKPE
ncbi:MAG: Ger(x)C family spore germination protein [Oscillospiraceae bacterium]